MTIYNELVMFIKNDEKQRIGDQDLNIDVNKKIPLTCYASSTKVHVSIRLVCIQYMCSYIFNLYIFMCQ